MGGLVRERLISGGGGLVNVDVTIIFVGLKEKLQCNVYSPTLPLVDKKKVHFPLSS